MIRWRQYDMTIALSPSYYRIVAIVLSRCRIVAIVLSNCRHRTIALCIVALWILMCNNDGPNGIP
ncbi:hypothetical protein DPMN_187516 [Dreissena polymorpha]|uniref:Uncharacterized protein n=1 Tax=Dreissena polymorpha TaxID=45954 RepID=A0A9D4I944_DREPO|nr:hypothetical protein DPMN_187516 [Dreissena polymorpha]